MVFTTNFTKVGNSLYILVPSFIAERLEMKNGDTVEMRIEGNRVFIAMELKEEGNKNAFCGPDP